MKISDFKLSKTDESDQRVSLEQNILNSKHVHSVGYAVGRNLKMSYEITSETLIEMLRNLYTITKNNYVKKVIVTVGKSRKMTENQFYLIRAEMLVNNDLDITNIIHLNY